MAKRTEIRKDGDYENADHGRKPQQKALPEREHKGEKEGRRTSKGRQEDGPAPASARVDESTIDEVAVARLEAAKKSLPEGKAEKEAEKGNTQTRTHSELTAQSTRGTGETTAMMRRQGEDTPPTASPMRPGEETPIEGGTSAEEIATDEEKDNKKGNKQEPDWSWHSKTKPAEPEKCPSHVELEQVTYLVRWLQKDDEHRKRWEAN